VTIPDSAAVSWHASAIAIGYYEGAAHAGQAPHLHELHAALAIALGDEAIEARHAAGEDPLAPARTRPPPTRPVKRALGARASAGISRGTTMDARTASSQAEATKGEKIARRLLSVERLLMGVVFIVCGIAGILNLLPHGSADAGTAAVGGSLLKAGFLFPLMKGTEVLLEWYLASTGRKA
jgi:hypothetical protein